MHALEQSVLLLAALCVFQTGPIQIPAAHAADPALWEPVFVDEFNGPTIDRSKWSFEVNCDGGGNNEDQCYVDDGQTLTVRDGILSIRAIGNYAGSNGKRVRSARITTAQSQTFKYGRFESRIKNPTGNLLWPAWWLISYNGVHGIWPQSGEIDILEFQSQMPRVNFNTLHFGLPFPMNNFEGTGPIDVGANLSTGFFNYAMEWDPQEIRWYFEDRITHRASLDRWFLSKNGGRPSTYKKGSPFGAQMDSPMIMILNLAVGGNFFNSFLPPGQTINSNERDWATFTPYMIDYVRVYKSKRALPPYPAPPVGPQTCQVKRSADRNSVQRTIDFICGATNTACPTNCMSLPTTLSVLDLADKLYPAYFECAVKTQPPEQACNFDGNGLLISAGSTTPGQPQQPPPPAPGQPNTGGSLACRAKANAPPASIQAAVDWACSPENKACPVDCTATSYDNPISRASRVFNSYFKCASKSQPAADACNFGGAGELMTVTPPDNRVCVPVSGAPPSTLSSAIEWVCSSENRYCPIDCKQFVKAGVPLTTQAAGVYAAYYKCAVNVQPAQDACNFGNTARLTAPAQTVTANVCRPKPGANAAALESAMAWACSSANVNCPLDCNTLTRGAATVVDRATAVYNAYFKCASKLQSPADACDFGGTGQVSTQQCVVGDPSCAAQEVQNNPSGATSFIHGSSILSGIFGAILLLASQW